MSLYTSRVVTIFCDFEAPGFECNESYEASGKVNTIKEAARRQGWKGAGENWLCPDHAAQSAENPHDLDWLDHVPARP